MRQRPSTHVTRALSRKADGSRLVLRSGKAKPDTRWDGTHAPTALFDSFDRCDGCRGTSRQRVFQRPLPEVPSSAAHRSSTATRSTSPARRFVSTASTRRRAGKSTLAGQVRNIDAARPLLKPWTAFWRNPDPRAATSSNGIATAALWAIATGPMGPELPHGWYATATLLTGSATARAHMPVNRLQLVRSHRHVARRFRGPMGRSQGAARKLSHDRSDLDRTLPNRKRAVG